MRRVRRILLRLLPERVGAAALADLDREAQARATGVRTVLWYGWEGLGLVLHFWLAAAAAARQAPGSLAPLRSLRLAARSLGRAPAFTAGALLLLGAGIGGVTAVFALVDHLFLRPLPYPDAERLIRVNSSQSHPSLLDLEAMPSVEAWAAASNDDVNLIGQGDPVRVRQARVTEGFFALFGADPALGRLFVAEDFAYGDVVVLSHELWQRLWAGDPTVVGRAIRIDERPVRVVGVLRESFAAPEAILDGAGADLWRPIDRSSSDFGERAWHVLVPAGRLAPGRTVEEARREAAAVAERRAQAFPDYYVQRDGSHVPLPVESLHEATVGSARSGVRLLLGAVTLLLLVACANVAHLFVARGLGRFREIALRRALGAGFPQVAGQLLAESFLIALGGTLIGLLVAALGLRSFLLLSPNALPRAASLSLDARVFAFAAVASTVTALAFGLLPLVVARSADPADALRSAGRGATGGRRSRAFRGALVVFEVALSVVLVSCAGLFIQSFGRMRDQELGFRTDDVWTISVLLPEQGEVSDWRARMDRMADALGGAAGVRSVTYGLSVPLELLGGTCCWSRPVRTTAADDGPVALVHPFAGDYADVYEPRILAGRPWTPTEAEAAPPPALLNEPLAIELFGSVEAAVGRVVALGSANPEGLQVPDHLVVGVVSEDRHYGLVRQHGRATYVPISSLRYVPDRATFAVRVQPDAADLPRRLRAAVWTVEPDLPLPLVRPMTELAARATARTRFDAWLFSTFGVVALLLAAAGLYGTLLHAVAAERRNMGIRLALGARPRDVQRRVLQGGLATAALGALLGAAGAWASARLLASRLFGVSAGDPRTLLTSVAVLMLAAAVACWLPARRAGATDPLETLREE